MANLASFEIDGASYSYDAEIKNSLGTSMVKKIINNETAEVYAAGNQVLKEVKFWAEGLEFPSFIKIKYTGELNYSNLWIYNYNYTGCLGDKTKWMGDYSDPDNKKAILPNNTKDTNYKIISVELGSPYEGTVGGIFVDVSKYEKKTLECYNSSLKKVKVEYYGNLAKSVKGYYADSEGKKNINTNIDTSEKFFILISETEIA